MLDLKLINTVRKISEDAAAGIIGRCFLAHLHLLTGNVGGCAGNHESTGIGCINAQLAHLALAEQRNSACNHNNKGCDRAPWSCSSHKTQHRSFNQTLSTYS